MKVLILLFCISIVACDGFRPRHPQNINPSTGISQEQPIKIKGNEGAHGGGGVLVGNQIYLLDLLEFGLENKEFKSNVNITPECRRAVENRLPTIDFKIQTLFCQKLVLIRKRDALLAESLLFALRNLNWVFVNSALEIVEDFKPLIVIDENDIFQLASRTSTSVLISHIQWNRMKPTHQIALLIHELVYSLLALENGDAKVIRARELTAYLFGQGREENDWKDLKDIVGSDLPTLEALLYEEIHSPGFLPMIDGALSVQVGFDNPKAYNMANWVQQYYGKKFIAFGPIVRPLIRLINEKLESEDATLLEHIRELSIPTVGANKRRMDVADVVCQVIRPNIDIEIFALYFYTSSLFFEKRVETQTFYWFKGKKLEQYFTQIIEFDSKEECINSVIAALENEVQFWPE